MEKETFYDLNLTKPLFRALDENDFEYPTTIQEKAFPVIMSGADVVGIAQTGTGKTMAYLLPLIRLWKYNKDKKPRILVIVPTRELVVQVEEVVKMLTEFMSFDVVAAYGGANIKRHRAAINAGCDMVIATPGRLLDLGKEGTIKMMGIKKLVIDEVDEMLNLGFRHQLVEVFDLLLDKRQNLMFSATMTTEVENIIEEYFVAPRKIEAAPTGTPLENIEQSGYDVPNFNTKMNLLKNILQDKEVFQKVLVFTATKKLANSVFEDLETIFEEEVSIIHSNKSQNYRFRSINNFKEGKSRVLIATDIVARGIDVAEVSHVLNFDLPEIPENYMHRIGRTGRAEKDGIAISFITPKEKETQQSIEDLMNHKISMNVMPEEVEISAILTPDEMPQVKMRNLELRVSESARTGGAFHEKKDKNKKVNKKVRYESKMKLKYKKPKKRGGKK